MSEPPDEEDSPRRSRTREKTERVANESALKSLALRLTQLSPSEIQRLELPEDLRDDVADFHQIASHVARARHLRFLRNQLRSMDWLLLQRKVDSIRATGTTRDVSTGAAADWATRLQISGDEGVNQFLYEFPEADRKRLRQLVRAVQGAPETKKTKVRRQLESFIEVALRDQPEQAEQPEQPEQSERAHPRGD